jgi:hypothetical protein
MLLNSELWPQQLKVSKFDKANLVRDFDIQEIKCVIMEMKKTLLLAYRCGTHRILQRYDYKSWALAWPTDRSRKRCSNCYT